MSLGFLNPLFLFGLTAAVLPILIHRLTQRRPAMRSFSAVHLLLETQRVVTRTHHLKQLFLLFLRILAVVTLSFLMAQPVLFRPGLRTLAEEGANVILMDNSLSMAYEEEMQGDRFTLAQKAAQELIQGLKGKFLILPTVPGTGDRMEWKKGAEALKDLTAIPLSFGRGEPTFALNLAFRELRGLGMPREILILSDFARGDWDGLHLSSLETVSSEVGLTFLRIGGENRDANFAVRGIRLIGGEAVVGLPSQLECRVANLSDSPGAIRVQLFLSGIKVGEKEAALKAGEEGRVSFEVSSDRPGWVNGEIRLSQDRLPIDNVFYFPLRYRERIKVLVVDGDPKTSLQKSEAYYLAQALNPGKGEGSPFLPKVIPDMELAGIDLGSYEAVFLLNVEQPPVFKLAAFLETGRPVFIFLGDRVAPESYHAFPLFPWHLQGIKDAAGKEPLRIGQIDLTHDLLRSLFGAKGQALKAASFRRYYGVRGGHRNLLTLENQDPLLMEGRMGKGKVFLFASSADLDWNDLPLKAAYVPLVQGLLKEAVGLGKNPLPSHLTWGKPFLQGVKAAQLTGTPGGPGIYQIPRLAEEERQAINAPPEESDLRKMSPSEMREKFKGMNGQWLDYREEVLGRLTAGRIEFWPYLLAFLFILLVLEMGVASRL